MMIDVTISESLRYTLASSRIELSVIGIESPPFKEMR